MRAMCWLLQCFQLFVVMRPRVLRTQLVRGCGRRDDIGHRYPLCGWVGSRAARGRGAERPALTGRHAQLRALKEGRAWPNADFGGTGTDSGCVPDASGCNGMRRDESGCVGILNSGKIWATSLNI